MKCRECERLISDAIDGELSGRDGGRLAAHLEACPACLAYKRRLESIRERTGRGEAPPLSPGYLENFSARVETKIASLEASKSRGDRGFRLPKWVWLAAPAAAAALLIFLEIGRVGPSAALDISLGEGYLGAFSLAVADSPDLAVDLNALVAGSIQDDIGGVSPEEVASPVDDPSFWDSLSEDEAAAIDGEIRKEIRS